MITLRELPNGINSLYSELKERADDLAHELLDYTPILNSFGYKILLRVDEPGYQGDSFILFNHDDQEYGILILGWGSCSGCDALLACNTWQDVADLRKEIFEGIKWFDGIKELLNYLETHDWEGDYEWHSGEARCFVKMATDLCKVYI